MEIIYSKHAVKKFNDLAILGIQVKKLNISKTINQPIQIDELSDFPNKIALGILDKNHRLRVVYRIENDKIIVITFYPARKDRYS